MAYLLYRKYAKGILWLGIGEGIKALWARALVDFLTGDFAFEIVHKSTWHMNTILIFIEKNTPNYTNGEDF